MIPPSTRLRRAIHLRSLPLVTRILSSHPADDVLLRNADFTDDANTSLHLCALLGLPEIASYLLELGHEYNSISRSTAGITPLMVACQAGGDEDDSVVAGRIAVGRMLLEQLPEHACVRDRDGMDAFSHAAASGTNPLLLLMLSQPLHDFALEAIQDYGMYPPWFPQRPELDKDAPRPPFSATPRTDIQSNIQTFSPAPPSTTLSMTTTTGAHPLLSIRDLQGNTPLHHASSNGQLKTLRLLIAAGADHGARNAQTWTPIDYSASVTAEVYFRQLVKEQLAKQGITTGRQSPSSGGRSSPAWGSPSNTFASPVGVGSPGSVGSPIVGRSSPMPMGTPGSSAGQMGRKRGASDEKGQVGGMAGIGPFGRMRGGSDEKAGRSGPFIGAGLAGRLRGESDEKKRTAGAVRLVQREESTSEESDGERG